MTTTKDPDQIERSATSGRNRTQAFRVNHILAPTDLSRESRKAVNSAMWLAQRFHAKLTLLHLYEMLGTFECAFGVPEPEILQQNKDRAELSLLALSIIDRCWNKSGSPERKA